MATVSISVDLLGIKKLEQLWSPDKPYGGEYYDEITDTYKMSEPDGIRISIDDVEAVKGMVRELEQAAAVLEQVVKTPGVELAKTEPKSPTKKKARRNRAPQAGNVAAPRRAR